TEFLATIHEVSADGTAKATAQSISQCMGGTRGHFREARPSMNRLKLPMLLCISLLTMTSTYANVSWDPYQTGIEYLEQGNLKAAIQSFTTELEKNPR